jgi:AcrR family transcriptional regulator
LSKTPQASSRLRGDRLREHVLRTALRLVAERGVDAATTRLIAAEAGVNEVTLFRKYGDKASLLRAAVRRFSPVDKLAAYQVAGDLSQPREAAEAIVACLWFMRLQLIEHPELLQFGLAEYWRFPDLKDDIAAAPLAARGLLQRVLAQAAPALRPDVDPDAASLCLMGLLFMTVQWQLRGWIDLHDAAWRDLLQRAVRPYLRRLR